MGRRLAVVVSASLIAFGLVPSITVASGSDGFSPGAPGAGDPYFPLDGNGGYDVQHYRLEVRYDPATDLLVGTATITAVATQGLSSFNLDFQGLTVRSVVVQKRRASWTRDGGELVVTPARGIVGGSRFGVEIRYQGVPETLDEFGGPSGFLHTDDGALVVGEPHVAATWFPVNDHPIDTATYTFVITAPAGLEAVANGVLESHRTKGAWTTWTWRAEDPMASYLAGMGIGEFDLRAYTHDRIRFWDAFDPVLFAPPAVPRTGTQFAISQKADFSYKRLSHTIAVPAGGAELSFWVTRDTEPGWDFFFVEAHTAGADDDWTTLPDLNGHNGQDTGNVCPFWLGLHPFLEHYQTAIDPFEPPCEPAGSTGDWWAATGQSDGYELWTVDLSAWAGSTVDVSLSYASDDIIQHPGVFVDDVVVSTGEGTTSFEADGDELDGWTVAGPPEGSPGNENDWIVGAEDDTPPSPGEFAEGSFARQGEIIDFEEENFGPYPFGAAGGIVDDAELFFALENQTRPIYSPGFFTDPVSGDFVVVHELAHQWFGDSLTVEAWQHIWLNEGFATYAEWLWSEQEGFGTAQENFDFFYDVIPADDPFWSLTIGDPGPELLFDGAVYIRGGMTLHQLRLAVGDDAFFEILQQWAATQAGQNVSTEEFIALAEAISGQELDALFEVWLFTPGKPDLTAIRRPASSGATSGEAPVAARSLLERLGGGGALSKT